MRAGLESQSGVLRFKGLPVNLGHSNSQQIIMANNKKLTDELGLKKKDIDGVYIFLIKKSYFCGYHIHYFDD